MEPICSVICSSIRTHRCCRNSCGPANHIWMTGFNMLSPLSIATFSHSIKWLMKNKKVLHPNLSKCHPIVLCQQPKLEEHSSRKIIQTSFIIFSQKICIYVQCMVFEPKKSDLTRNFATILSTLILLADAFLLLKSHV